MERFPRVTWWVKGYDRSQVDRYVLHTESALLAGRTSVTAADIRKVGFDLVRAGYDVAAVDRHLDALELRAVRLERSLVGASRVPDRRGEPAPSERLDADAPRGRRFPRQQGLRRGYDADEVDDFVERLEATLSDTSDGDLDIDAVRSVVFRGKRGGYDEDAVDDYLDAAVELLLRRTA
jgi:DivIVA domain-containing protein